MNKRLLIKKIIERLTAEPAVYYRAAQFSRAEATHEQNKAESKYDTRGIEASYLARGQSKQAAELETAIETYQKMNVRKFAPEDPIQYGALVELDQDGERNLYFIGGNGRGAGSGEPEGGRKSEKRESGNRETGAGKQGGPRPSCRKIFGTKF